MSPEAAAELGLEPRPALCCLRWGRILRTSLIHVLLEKSIRSAWISLSISPVHCHVALWSSLSNWDGKAPKWEGWQRTARWGWAGSSARLFPGLCIVLASTEEPEQVCTAGEKQVKRTTGCEASPPRRPTAVWYLDLPELPKQGCCPASHPAWQEERFPNADCVGCPYSPKSPSSLKEGEIPSFVGTSSLKSFFKVQSSK